MNGPLHRRERPTDRKPVPFSRRRLFRAGLAAALTGGWTGHQRCPGQTALPAAPQPATDPDQSKTGGRRRPRVGVLLTVCYFRSHAHVLLENFLGPYLFNGRRTDPGVDVVAIYADQRRNDDLLDVVQRDYGVPLFPTIREALCAGGDRLAVDAVLSIGEHGSYPKSKLGQTMYPRKRFFDEAVAVMKQSNRFVPFFNDKHLSWNWDEATEMYRTARRLGIPLMAGSSVPLATRRPVLELPPGQMIDEAVSIHGGPLESYDFHGLEVLESMVESRRGGETGVAGVEFLKGDDVWQAAQAGRWSLELARQAMRAELGRPLEDLRRIPGEEPRPVHAVLVRFRDGLRATILRVGHNSTRWNFACRLNGKPQIHATSFYVGPWDNRNLFKALSHAIQTFFITRRAPYPVERTLLTTGTLEAAMRAAQNPGREIATPHLAIAYQPVDFRAMREMGATWSILTPDIPQPPGFHRFDDVP